MKKIFIVLVITLLFTLSGCKSSEVKNVEKLIDNLVEDIKEIEKVEFEYNKLSKEDKEDVDNYEQLISMKKKIYSGVYQRLSFNDYIQKNETRISLPANGDWTIQGNTIEVGQYKLTITEKYGVTALIDNRDSYDTKIFVKTDDAKVIYEKAILKVELTLDNFYDYFGTDYIGENYDQWGEPTGMNYIFYSKAYQNGYVFCKYKNAGVKGPTINYPDSLPFNVKVQTDAKIEIVRGTVYYIHKDYVSSYIFTSSRREFKAFGEHMGMTASSGWNTKYPW